MVSVMRHVPNIRLYGNPKEISSPQFQHGLGLALSLLFAWGAIVNSTLASAAELTLDDFIEGGRVSAPYGLSREGKRDHSGVDVAAPKGTPVRAPDDAVVVQATDLFRDQPAYGKTVVLKFADNLLSWFTHLDSYSVKRGDTLKRGDAFGTVGNTGGSKSFHIHIQTYTGAVLDERIDPASVWSFLKTGEQRPNTPSPLKNAMRVRYKGYSPDTIADIYNGNWRRGAVQLSGKLYLPDGEGRFPVVVLQHGSGNPDVLTSWWNYLVPALRNVGIGAFIADSYGGRAIGQTSVDQTQLSKAARIVDAFMALYALSKVPSVDPSRIGVTGYSFGGGTALDTADRRAVVAVLGDKLRFAAHLPVYPNCVLRKSIDFTGAPMHFLLAAKDDHSRPAHCLSLIEHLKGAGVAASQTVYPDAGHGFVLVRSRFLKQAANFRNCPPATLAEDGHIDGDGFSDRGGSWADYVKAAFKKCGTRGAHVAGTISTRQRARDDTVEFFRAALGP